MLLGPSQELLSGAASRSNGPHPAPEGKKHNTASTQICRSSYERTYQGGGKIPTSVPVWAIRGGKKSPAWLFECRRPGKSSRITAEIAETDMRRPATANPVFTPPRIKSMLEIWPQISSLSCVDCFTLLYLVTFKILVVKPSK